MKLRFFVLILLCGMVFNRPISQAQDRGSKEYKLYSEAQDQLFKKDYEGAIESLKKIFKINPDHLNAMLLISRIYNELGEFDQSEEVFKQWAIRHPEETYKADMQIATIKMRREQYKEAITLLDHIITNEKTPENTKNYAIKTKDTCQFRAKLMSVIYPFNRISLGDSVNSSYNEYLPILTADETRIFFTRMDFPPSSPLGNEDFYFCDRDSIWHLAKPLGEAINSPGLEGALTISPDGKKMFFAAKERRGGYGNFDLYYTYKLNDQWVKPLNLGPPINDAGWESQPSISADGTELFFAAKRYGNVGGIDLWMSKLVNNYWTKPVNLGSVINTAGNEQSPYIHPDGHTLYFSSDGHLGLGSADLFLSRRDQDGNWGKPICLPAPINTKENENGLFVNAEGIKAYYSAYNTGTKNLDIYQFDLPEPFRPSWVTYIKGTIKDADTKLPIQAVISLSSRDNFMPTQSITTDEKGEFLITIPSGHPYSCNVDKADYLFYSENFDLSNNAKSDPYTLNIFLQKIKPAETLVLNNIFFETGKYDLKKESFPELDKLYELLAQNNEMMVTIVGHTDNVGNAAANLQLSIDRANSVGQYLIGKGILQSRLKYDGKGDTQPVAENSTDAGKAKNRRVEIKF